MSLRISARALLLSAMLLMPMTPLAAQEAEEPWQFTVEPYVFMDSLNGNAAIGRAEADVDASFSDILKNLKMAAMMNVEANNGRWGVIGDLQYMKLGMSGGLRGDFVTLRDKMTSVEADGFYRWTIGGRSTIDALVGARYWNMRLTATLAGPPADPAARSADWLDPVVGVRLIVPLAEDWALTFRGDIGGFGIGSSFTWQVQAGIVYNVSKGVAIALLYRRLDVDFSKGAANTPGRFVFDAALHGPQLGFRFAL